jgi:hypothetical protein
MARNPRKYSLTDDRRKTAEDRLIYRMEAGHLSILEAEQEARIAIDNLAASQWHRDNGQIDWDLIFRSNSTFEERLNAIQRKPDGENQRKPASAVEQRQEQNRSVIQSVLARKLGHSGGMAHGSDAAAAPGHDPDRRVR